MDLFEKRLAGWKRNFLSKGGKLSLMKSTLANLPIYYLSILTISASIAAKLENIQCRFLWGDEEGFRKYHLVRWEDVKKPIRDRGLGLRSIRLMKSALQGKWLWRFLIEEDKLWKRVVKARWGDWERNGGKRGRYKPHVMSLWKKIRGGSNVFLRCMCWQVGNGREIWFWQDE